MPIVVPKNRPPTTPGEIIQEEFLVPLDMSLWNAKKAKPARGLQRLEALKTA